MSSNTSNESTPLLNPEQGIDVMLSLPPILDSQGLKIAIIDGGVTCLLTACVLKSRGFTDLTLFEASSKVVGADERWNLSSRIPEEELPVLFIGPFEHHPNELSWRESLATVIVIPEDNYGYPHMKVL